MTLVLSSHMTSNAQGPVSAQLSTEYTILIAKVCLIFTIADITLKKQLHLRTQFHAVRQTHIVDTEKLNLFCFERCYQYIS